MHLKQFLQIFDKKKPGTISITYNKYNKVLVKTLSTIKEDLTSFANSLGLAKGKVVFISVDRGGSIPTTIMDYSIGSFIKKFGLTYKITTTRLNLPLSTRDIKQGETNEEALLRIKESVNKILRPTKLHTGRPIRIYIIDDLLDSGATLDLIAKNFLNESWYKDIRFVFLYHVKNHNENGFLISKHDFGHPFNTLDWLLLTLVSAKQLIIGKTLKTTKWLNFWYEKI